MKNFEISIVPRFSLLSLLEHRKAPRVLLDSLNLNNIDFEPSTNFESLAPLLPSHKPCYSDLTDVSKML